jgi:indole-3-glycerol phosphate synthase
LLHLFALLPAGPMSTSAAAAAFTTPAGLPSTSSSSSCASPAKRARRIHSTRLGYGADSSSSSSSPPVGESIYESVHRKEHEMKQVKAMHTSTTDPVIMAMSYADQSSDPPLRLAKALRRVYEDPCNPSNPNAVSKSGDQSKRDRQLSEIGMADLGMRRASMVVDVKRKSPRHKNRPLCRFDDAGMVAEAMVRLGCDAVFINTDYGTYGGDMSELKSAVQRVRLASKTAAVVMKDVVVDEIQLGLAKEAGADAIVLMACVLGPALSNFLDLATTIGLETIVECHTRDEVQEALNLMATNILVNNYDRIGQQLHPDQALKLAGMFPGSGGPVICLATGGLESSRQLKAHLDAGYDGVVVGRACMGSPRAPELIRAVRDRTLLPAEMSAWGIDADFDLDGNLVGDGTAASKRNLPSEDDADVYQ